MCGTQPEAGQPLLLAGRGRAAAQSGGLEAMPPSAACLCRTPLQPQAFAYVWILGPRFLARRLHLLLRTCLPTTRPPLHHAALPCSASPPGWLHPALCTQDAPAADLPSAVPAAVQVAAEFIRSPDSFQFDLAGNPAVAQLAGSAQHGALHRLLTIFLTGTIQVRPAAGWGWAALQAGY